MLILLRLIARSSRSLAVMTGYTRAGSGRGRGGRAGSPDDDAHIAAVSLPAFSPLHPLPRLAAPTTADSRRRRSFA
jgi:hypothetical protein